MQKVAPAATGSPHFAQNVNSGPEATGRIEITAKVAGILMSFHLNGDCVSIDEKNAGAAHSEIALNLD